MLQFRRSCTAAGGWDTREQRCNIATINAHAVAINNIQNRT